MSNPKVSIIMGIYNCERTLIEAIDSIEAQTFSNWELIMCDDGSSDNTVAIASQYVKKNPDKFILIKNKKNMGLNYTLNKCLEFAKGEYIARMDGDDISISTRLEKEVNFLDHNPEFAIVSTPMIMFDSDGEWGKTSVIEYPKKKDFCTHTPFFCHAASVIRKEAFDTVHGYTEDPRFLRVEDCNLWFRIYAAGYIGANLTEPLYKMRDDRNATHRRTFRARMNGCYVLYDGFKMLNMPWYEYRFVLKNYIIELAKCFIPESLYHWFHKYKYK